MTVSTRSAAAQVPDETSAAPSVTNVPNVHWTSTVKIALRRACYFVLRRALFWRDYYHVFARTRLSKRVRPSGYGSYESGNFLPRLERGVPALRRASPFRKACGVGIRNWRKHMEAAVIEKPDDSAVTLAPIHRMAKKLKLQQELRVISPGVASPVIFCICRTLSIGHVLLGKWETILSRPSCVTTR
jgi:hypothetical protein